MKALLNRMYEESLPGRADQRNWQKQRRACIKALDQACWRWSRFTPIGEFEHMLYIRREAQVAKTQNSASAIDRPALPSAVYSQSNTRSLPLAQPPVSPIRNSTLDLNSVHSQLVSKESDQASIQITSIDTILDIGRDKASIKKDEMDIEEQELGIKNEIVLKDEMDIEEQQLGIKHEIVSKVL